MTARQAVSHANANLRYILRSSATQPEDLFTLNLDSSARDPQAIKKVLARELEERANRGGERGVRLAEKIIVSLPNNMIGGPARDAVKLIAERLAAGSPDVRIVAAIHTDKPDNLHIHLFVIDGLETEAMARKRATPNTRRIRRGCVVRLGDRGRPKELRRLIAASINEVAQRHGTTKVEYRSFKERGIERQSQNHDGPQKRARLAKSREAAYWSGSDLAVENIAEIFSEPAHVAHPISDPTIDTMWQVFQSAARAAQKAQRGLNR